jgi:hypothetical protein
VATLSKFLDKAGDSHWNAAIQVLLYLKGTLSYGIPLGGRSDITDLKAYVDADYANDKQDYRSVSGYLVFAGDSLISWMSKKQGSVTLSTTEAEFIALTEVTKEVLWIQPIFKFLGYRDIEKLTVIYEDNMPVINLALNQQTKGRTKHLSVKVRFIAELIEKGIFSLRKVSSAENIADTMTKALDRIMFLKHRTKFLMDVHAV